MRVMTLLANGAAGQSDQHLRQTLTGAGAVVFIVALGLAGTIVLLSLIIARRMWQRRRDAMPARHQRGACPDAWAAAGTRAQPPEDEDEDGPETKP